MVLAAVILVRPEARIVARALGSGSAVWSVLGSEADFSLPDACVIQSQAETSVTCKHGIWSFPSLALLFLVFLLSFCQPGSCYQKNGGPSICFGCLPPTPLTCRCPHWVTATNRPQGKLGRKKWGGGGKRRPACCRLLQLLNPHQNLPAFFQSTESSKKMFLCILSRVCG